MAISGAARLRASARLHADTRTVSHRDTALQAPAGRYSGQPIRCRAASYSITVQSLWALDVLREEGFVYDSEHLPIRHDLYGIPSHPRFCYMIPGQSGAPLVEFPLSTLRLGGTNFPIAGGGYLRLFPYAYTRWGIRYLNRREGQPAVVYLHPWELDPEQPRLPAGKLSRFRHYTNLHKMEERFVRLLQTSPLVLCQKSCKPVDFSVPYAMLREGALASQQGLLA